MEHDIPFGNSNRENGTTFLDFPLFLGIFQWDEPTKRVPFTAELEIQEILTKWKAPVVLYNCNRLELTGIGSETQFILSSFTRNGEEAIFSVCRISFPVLQFHSEFVFRFRQAVDFVESKPKFTIQVSKATFVVFPSAVQEFNRTVQSLLDHRPTSTGCFLVTEHIKEA